MMLIVFLKGYWEKVEEVYGDKRNVEDFERWRGFVKIGI